MTYLPTEAFKALPSDQKAVILAEMTANDTDAIANGPTCSRYLRVLADEELDAENVRMFGLD